MTKKEFNPRTNDAVEYAKDVFLITPNDSTDLTTFTRGISLGTEGDLKIDTIDGTTVTIPSGALAAGVIHPIGVARVHATGTTASDIVGYV